MKLYIGTFEVKKMKNSNKNHSSRILNEYARYLLIFQYICRMILLQMGLGNIGFIMEVQEKGD